MTTQKRTYGSKVHIGTTESDHIGHHSGTDIHQTNVRRVDTESRFLIEVKIINLGIQGIKRLDFKGGIRVVGHFTCRLGFFSSSNRIFQEDLGSSQVESVHGLDVVDALASSALATFPRSALATFSRSDLATFARSALATFVRRALAHLLGRRALAHLLAGRLVRFVSLFHLHSSRNGEEQDEDDRREKEAW